MNTPTARSSAELDALIAEVTEEFRERRRQGECPDVEEFVARHPEAAGEVRMALAAFVHLDPTPRDRRLEVGVGIVLGDFRLLREIGRGGMGVVWEAEQLNLGRRVALKVLPFSATLNARQVQRFQNEARAAAALKHPNIVPVYHVGYDRDVHYYAMQFVEGCNLAQVWQSLRGCHSGPDTHDSLPPSSSETVPVPAGVVRSGAPQCQPPSFVAGVAAWGLQAAEALDHAHRAGVIHRDVKPANLLLDRDGKLWVADFGLARIGVTEGLTATGDILGTLRYMSPEQASGKRDAVDGRSDVYSLGVTLYELLTLQPAFQGKDARETLELILQGKTAFPRRIDPSVTRNLEAVVLKAMARCSADRYPTAGAFADDLRHFLNNEPTIARPPGLLTCLVRRIREPRLARVLALGTAALVLLAAMSVWLGRLPDGPVGASPLADGAAEIGLDPFNGILDKPRWLGPPRGKWKQAGGETWQEYQGGVVYLPRTGKAFAIPGNPDDPNTFRGRLVAFGGVKRLGFPVGEMQQEDGYSWQPFREGAIFHSKSLGAQVVLGSQDDQNTFWGRFIAAGGAARLGLPVSEMGHGERYTCQRFQRGIIFHSPAAGAHAVPGSAEDPKTFWGRMSSCGVVGAGHYPRIGLPVGEVIAGNGYTYQVFWNGVIYRSEAYGTHAVLGDPKDPKTIRGQFAASGGVERLGLPTGENMQEDGYSWQPFQKNCITRSEAGGTHVIPGDPNDANTFFGRYAAARKLGGLGPASSEVKRETGYSWQRFRNGVIYHSTAMGTHAVLGDPSDSNSFWGWFLASGGVARVGLPVGERTEDRGHAYQLFQKAVFCRPNRPGARGIAVFGDPSDPRTFLGRFIATAGRLGRPTTEAVPSVTPGVRHQDFEKGTIYHSVATGAHAIYGDPRDPNTLWGRFAASRYEHGIGVPTSEANLGDWVTSQRFQKGIIYIPAITEAHVPQILLGHAPDETWAVAFSPDSRTLASAGDDHLVRLWDLRTFRQRAALRGHPTLVLSAAWSSDGSTLASTDYRGQIRLWDPQTGRERRTFAAHERRARGVALSPDGKTLATVGDDHLVKLWDLPDGKPRPPLAGHDDKVTCVAFTPDGKTLVSGGNDGQLITWDASSGRLLRTVILDDKIRSAACSSDSKFLAVATEDGTVHLRRTSGEPVHILNSHTKSVRSVAFSPNGKTLASGGQDRTVRLWHVASGKELLCLKDQPHQVNGVAFSPDGKTLAVALHDGSIRLYRASRGE